MVPKPASHPDATSLTVRIQEDHPPLGQEANQDHVDITLPLQSGSTQTQWEKWVDADGTGPNGFVAQGAGSPLEENMTDGFNAYVTSFEWNTTNEMLGTVSKLLGHNGSHTVKVLRVNAGSATLSQMPFQSWPPLATQWEDAPKALPSLNVNIDNKWTVEWLSGDGVRACAGGVAVDGVHDFTLTGVLRLSDGTVAANTRLKFFFENNKGHDYTNDDLGVKPIGWTVGQIKRAKLVTTGVNGSQNLTEEAIIDTDSNGQFSVKVLSSDIVSSDIKIKVVRDMQGQQQDVGEQTCRFEQAAYKRRFANPFNSNERYPQEDYGWLLQRQWLSSTSSQTTAKLYLKFMRNPTEPDQDGNWDFVSGHRMMFEIESIEDHEGNIVTATDDYVVFASSGQANAFVTTVASDGAATVVLQAGSKIAKVKTIHLKGYDESQWSE